MSGLEAEYFLVDQQGRVVDDTDKLVAEYKRKTGEKDIRKEACKAMVEFGSYPSVRVVDTTLDLVKRIESFASFIENQGLMMFPFGSYPGKINPKMRKSKWYSAQSKILGRNKWKLAGLCAGMHYHYTLPRGIFDRKKKTLRVMPRSKYKDSLIHSYNFAIAIDPVLVTLMQSSPFFQGHYLAKDSRALSYRGDKYFDYAESLYYTQPLFGVLPEYKHTITDIIHVINKKHNKWAELMEQNGFDSSPIKRKNPMLFAWNTMRVNRLGTLEIRSMDVNYPKYVVALTTVLKFLFKKIQHEFIEVVPSDIGTEEPFKLEDRKLYVPPYSVVRASLQTEAVFKGLESDIVLNYCQKFFKLAESLSKRKYSDFIVPFKEILDSRKTISDQVLKKIKDLGGDPSDLSNDIAHEVALHYSEDFLPQVQKLKESLEKAL